MKKIWKIFLPLLILALLFAAFSIASFAISAKEKPEAKLASSTSEYSYKYTSGGATVYATADSTLAEIISLADENTEIVFLKDVIVNTPSFDENSGSYCYVDKPLTLNLNGNTLYFSQSHKSSFIHVTTTEPVTVKNGTAVWNINQNYLDKYDSGASASANAQMSFALFSAVSNANISFTDMKTYGGVVVYSYSGTGITVNIDGGEYHLSKSRDLFGSCLFDIRANATVNISNALIDLQNSNTSLFSLTSYKETGSTKKSEATLNNCDIIAESASTNILPYMNNYTTATFNNCRIFGSINPSKYRTDSSSSFTISDPVAGSVSLLGGTLYMAEATLKDQVVVTDPTTVPATVSETRTFDLVTSTGTMFDTSSITFGLETSTKSYTFDLSSGEPPLPKYTVNFYQEDGVTVIATMSVEKGSSATPPSYSAGGSNGWYSIGYDGWTTALGSSDRVTDFTITADTDFYPAVADNQEKPIANLSVAQYNLNFTDSVILNFYLPIAPSGVTKVKVTDENGNTLTYRNVSVTSDNGKKYYRLYEVASLSPTELTTTRTVTVHFNVGEEALTETISLSPLSYAKTILADSKSQTPTWSSKTHTLIADMVRYSNYLTYAAKGSYVEELTELTDAYALRLTPLPSRNDFTNTTSMYALSGYVDSVQFAISDFKPQWIINVNSAKSIVDVSISVDGYLPMPDATTGVNFGNIVYGIDKVNTTYSGSYITSAYIESMPIYNMDRDITITVKTASGTTVSATYNLDSYFNRMSAAGDELHSYQKFLQSFRAFGQSSSGYKYADGIVTGTATAKDFFECDHANAKTKSLNLTSGRFCSTCQTYIFFYDDFINSSGNGGAVYTSRDAAMSGKVNSYPSIDYCHAKANTRAGSGYKVGCVATPGAVYYLSYPTKYNGNVDEITVQTDTQWAGAYIISDESEIDVTDTAFSKNFFCVRGFTQTSPNGTYYSTSGTDVTGFFTSDIKAGTTKLPFAPGMPMMLYLHDASVKHYIRNGANQNTGANQTEVILIDEFGNVSNTTPIEWDYTYNSSTSVFYVKAYNVTDKPIKISGLDSSGNITAKFENIPNNSIDATSYKNVKRGIMVRRSNVTVEGIYHIFSEDDTNTTPRQAYAGFKAWIANNVVFKDMSVWQHMNHYVQNSSGVNTTNLLGSYEFGADDAINVSWINCKVRNFFNNDGSLDYHGLFGTNRVRNMYLRDCFLTSFDAHSGAGNVTIYNSTFEHLNFIGAGDITLNDVTIYQANGGGAALILRKDYGSRWRGNVYIDGLELRYDPSNYTLSYIDLVRAHYTNWDFGYGTAQGSNERPANIYANDVSIMKYSRKGTYNTTVNFDAYGKVIESSLTKGTLPLGIYKFLDAELNSSSSYDYSTINTLNKNPMGCTKNIYITNSDVSISYPTKSFFKDMNIYIDGVEQSWY